MIACQEETRQEISQPRQPLRLENTGISAREEEFTSASQLEIRLILYFLILLN